MLDNKLSKEKFNEIISNEIVSFDKFLNEGVYDPHMSTFFLAGYSFSKSYVSRTLFAGQAKMQRDNFLSNTLKKETDFIKKYRKVHLML